MKKRYVVAAGSDLKVSAVLKRSVAHVSPERLFAVKHCPTGHINIWDADGRPPKNCWHCDRKIKYGS